MGLYQRIIGINSCKKIIKTVYMVLLVFIVVLFAGCNTEKNKNQNKEIADQLNEALSNNNTDLVKNILTDKLKRTESEHLEDLVNFVSGKIVEVGDLSIANTCESDKKAILYTYHVRYYLKDDEGNRYYVAIEYTKKSKMNTDAGVTYISVSLLNDDDTDSSVVSIGKAT